MKFLPPFQPTIFRSCRLNRQGAGFSFTEAFLDNLDSSYLHFVRNLNGHGQVTYAASRLQE
jgi:hypothetical protein